jgi:hypothetical protein
MKKEEITGLSIPEVQKELQTVLKTYKASKIEINLEGSQFIRVFYKIETTVYETNEKSVELKNYPLKNSTPVLDEETEEVLNLEEMHLHNWNNSPVGTAILGAVVKHLAKIAE